MSCQKQNCGPEDSRARMYPGLDSGPAPLEKELDSTGNYCVAFAIANPNLCCWKTWQQSWIAELDKLHGTWPRSGIVSNGIVYRRPTSALLMRGTGGMLLPTVTANESTAFLGGPIRTGETWRTTTRLGHKLIGMERDMTGQRRAMDKPFCHPDFAEWMMGFPPRWTELDA